MENLIKRIEESAELFEFLCNRAYTWLKIVNGNCDSILSYELSGNDIEFQLRSDEYMQASRYYDQKFMLILFTSSDDEFEALCDREKQRIKEIEEKKLAEAKRKHTDAKRKQLWDLQKQVEQLKKEIAS